MLDSRGGSIQLFGVWTYGTVELQFQWYVNRPPFDSADKRGDLLSRLNGIKGINLPADSIARRPGFTLRVLKEKSALSQFLEIFSWFINEVKASDRDS